jgi:alpha-mannosidase
VAWLKRWFEGYSAPEDVRSQAMFRRLLSNGQIELVDGGFSQHDDVITDVAQQLQNMRQGRQWLLKRFGAPDGVPRHGWHPDSFSSTSATPTVYALLGCDALVHDRMNDDIKTGLASNASLEFVWQGSSSLSPERSSILLHVIYGQFHTGYQSPVCFDWEQDQVRTVCPQLFALN